jgi:L-ascorbate metabolism protein UlaG (beta-lactamase superfamily)
MLRRTFTTLDLAGATGLCRGPHHIHLCFTTQQKLYTIGRVRSPPTPRETPIPDPIREQYASFCGSPRDGGRFRNPWPHPAVAGVGELLRWKFEPNVARPHGYRVRPIATAEAGLAAFEALSGAPTRLFWIGHASFLLEMDGLRIVIDPIFGRAALVTPRVTPAAAQAEQLGEIAAVLVTHGHHDHLDPSSLVALAKANRGRTLFIVPTGLSAALPSECRPVVELSWWQHLELGPLRVHLVPAQHWHQRGPFDRNRRLWGGYVVEGTHRVYHSGDTGYFGGFGAIGRVYGGIDAACLPLGAYEPAWFMAAQHMSPEQSLAAYHDLAATHFVGMHWGTFDLSNEALDAGPRWLSQAVAAQGLPAAQFHVLAPGGSLALHGPRGHTRGSPRHLYRPDP